MAAKQKAKKAPKKKAPKKLKRTPPAPSAVGTWSCQSARCSVGLGHWTRPSLSRDGKSCEVCGAPRPAEMRLPPTA